MSEVVPLPSFGEVFFDARGQDRVLRVTWHEGTLVLSLWRGEMCSASFRMPMEDVGRLIETLDVGFAEAGGQHVPRAGHQQDAGTGPIPLMEAPEYPGTGQYARPAQLPEQPAYDQGYPAQDAAPDYGPDYGPPRAVPFQPEPGPLPAPPAPTPSPAALGPNDVLVARGTPPPDRLVASYVDSVPRENMIVGDALPFDPQPVSQGGHYEPPGGLYDAPNGPAQGTAFDPGPRHPVSPPYDSYEPQPTAYEQQMTGFHDSQVTARLRPPDAYEAPGFGPHDAQPVGEPVYQFPSPIPGRPPYRFDPPPAEPPYQDQPHSGPGQPIPGQFQGAPNYGPPHPGQVPGPQPTGPQPTGPQPTGPQPTGPQPTGPQPTGPHLHAQQGAGYPGPGQQGPVHPGLAQPVPGQQPGAVDPNDPLGLGPGPHRHPDPTLTRPYVQEQIYTTGERLRRPEPRPDQRPGQWDEQRPDQRPEQWDEQWDERRDW